MASSEFGEVRRWARENGYAVGDKGRVSGRVIEAYNHATGANVVNRSGRQRRRADTRQALEVEATTRQIRKSTVHVRVFVRDEHGVEYPFHPDLLLPLSRPSRAVLISSDADAVPAFEWPNR